MRRDLHNRLERLERRMAPPPNAPSLEKQEETDELDELHFGSWLEGRTLDDIPEQNRNAETWSNVEKYGPFILGLAWEGLIEGREELFAAGVDFNRAYDLSDVIGGRLEPPAQDAPRKLP